jgi:hypothetical protein
MFQQITDKVPQLPHRFDSRGLKVVTEQGGVEGLRTLVMLARSLQMTTERLQRLCTAVVNRAQPGVEHEIGELAIFAQAAQDRPDLTHGKLEHRDLLVEQRRDLLL